MIDRAARALPASAAGGRSAMAGRSRRCRLHAGERSRGFTLLELLVIILIIGIIVTFASLSIGNRALDDRLEAESKRLEQLLRLAEDEADLKGVAIGLQFTDTGYRFLVTDNNNRWVDYATSGILRPRALLEPFYAELRMEGRLIPPVKLDSAEVRAGDDEARAKAVKPQVLLLPGGQLTAFTLDIKAPNYPSYFRIEGDTLGRIKRDRKQEERAVTR